jgi:hypothetical protein
MKHPTPIKNLQISLILAKRELNNAERIINDPNFPNHGVKGQYTINLPKIKAKANRAFNRYRNALVDARYPEYTHLKEESAESIWIRITN